jgi:general stress protein 26
MKGEDDAGRIWDIVERVGVCMLTTRGSRGLRARPLEARPDRNAKTIWFITDVRSSKEEEIAVDNEIGLVFIDKDESVYLAIAACAEEVRDRDVAFDLANDRQHVVERAGRSERRPLASHSAQGRIMGWPFE